jgi:hypothetical protein
MNHERCDDTKGTMMHGAETYEEEMEDEIATVIKKTKQGSGKKRKGNKMEKGYDQESRGRIP